jgi:hypothetical protein
MTEDDWLEARIEAEADLDRIDRFDGVLKGLSKRDAANAVVSMIAALFDGAEFDQIVSDLTELQKYMRGSLS